MRMNASMPWKMPGHAVERLSRLLTDLRKLSDLGERPIERRPGRCPRLVAGCGGRCACVACLRGTGCQSADSQSAVTIPHDYR